LVVDFCRFRTFLHVIRVMPFIVGQQTRRPTRHEEDVMAKFLYLFSGGQMADTPEAQEAATQEWIAWFGSLGDSVVDMGNPFGASSTVTNGSASDGGASKLGGYTIINAESLEVAATNAKGCPVLRSGGSVEVYEALPM
jgi:S1-C subfamily serine protease